ncbi:MAG: siderophore-interacting protein [Propioniciclava sp.]|uniref:SIP domain-containing protein n=1 Tax=Propioniciclava sp. TaxID=2038686 RepID=UPI0039E55E94
MLQSIRPATVFGITTRRLQVIRAVDVTPGMRRVTLGGPGLAAHAAPNGNPVAAFRSEGFDDEFKVILPNPQTGELLVPAQGEGTLDWPREAFGNTRTYTIRRWDPEAGELDLDVVKHGSGPGTTWAYSCRPGDDIHIAGPKVSSGHPPARWVLIAGDETALPAIGRWLEEMPAESVAEVFIEVADATRIQDLAAPSGARITWLTRDGAPAGTTTWLFDALRAAPWHGDDVYAWVAGEAITLAPIRRWLRQEKGLPKERVEVTGYWRRAGNADGAAEVSAPEEDPEDYLHELLEIVPGIAIRTASTLGLLNALTAGPTSASALAARLGLHAGATARLLAYLAALDLTEAEGGSWRLTPTGVMLTDEDAAESLDLTSFEGRSLLGIVGLPDAVRTGASGYHAAFGAPFTDVVRAAEPERLHDVRARVIAEPLARSSLITGLRELRLAGPGVLDVGAVLARTLPELSLILLVTPSQKALVEAEPWVDGNRIRVEVGGLLDARPVTSEAFLLLNPLVDLPDADAAHVLAQAAASTGDRSVLLIDRPLGEDAGEHEREQDLIALATTGGAVRTEAATDALAEDAGLHLVARETIGWGLRLRRYAC